MRIRYMKAEDAEQAKIYECPNFSITGCIGGMKKIYRRTSQYYENGKQVLLVRSAGYIYHVPRCIYDKAY